MTDPLDKFKAPRNLTGDERLRYITKVILQRDAELDLLRQNLDTRDLALFRAVEHTQETEARLANKEKHLQLQETRVDAKLEELRALRTELLGIIALTVEGDSDGPHDATPTADARHETEPRPS